MKGFSVSFASVIKWEPYQHGYAYETLSRIFNSDYSEDFDRIMGEAGEVRTIKRIAIADFNAHSDTPHSRFGRAFPTDHTLASLSGRPGN